MNNWQNHFEPEKELARGALTVFDPSPNPVVVKKPKLLKPKKKPYYQRGKLEKMADRFRPKD